MPEARAVLDTCYQNGFSKLDAIENKIKKSLTEDVKNTMLENIKSSITDDLVKPRAKPRILHHVYDAAGVKRSLTEKERTFLDKCMGVIGHNDYGRVGDDFEKRAFEINELQRNLIKELTDKAYNFYALAERLSSDKGTIFQLKQIKKAI